LCLFSACTSNDDDNLRTNPETGASSSSSSSSATSASTLDIQFYTGSLSETETLPADPTLEAYNDYIELDEDYAAGWANAIYIAYSEGSAEITGLEAGDADFTVEQTGAHVTITAQKKAHYILSGSASDGSFTIDGAEKKAWVTLNGLTLSSTDGAVINKVSDKRLYLELADGTANTLSDGTASDHKATVFSAGKLAVSGKGTLTVTANYKNCIHSSDYIRIRPYTRMMLYANANNGIKANDSIVVEGGILNIQVSSTAGKGLSSDGYVKIRGGRTTVITSGGGTWDSADNSTSACAGIKADIDYEQSGGTVCLKSTGQGGKGLSTDGAAYIYNGTMRIATTGSKYTYGSGRSSDYTSSPKGIKADGNLLISGGDIAVSSSQHEGIESKGTITVSGGYVYVNASDDAMNSAGNFTISGGYLMGYSTGNDGLDANGNFYIQGGTLLAIGQSSPEVALDANTEDGCQLYVTDGNLVAIGGLENGANLSQSCYQVSSFSRGVSYALYNGSALALAFTVPSGNMGSPMVVSTSSTPTLSSGVTTSGTPFWTGYGYPSASGGNTVTLSSYSGGNGGMGGGNFNPGGGPGRR